MPDPWLDHNFVPGLLRTKVEALYKEFGNSRLDTRKAKVLYLESKCPWMAAAIDWLGCLALEGKHLLEFGSNTIDVEQVVGKPFTLERAASMQELVFGNRHLSIPALDWLICCSQVIHEVPESTRTILEELCRTSIETDRLLTERNATT